LNLEFLLAVCFGIGVAGVLSKAAQNQKSGLAFRLRTPPVTTRVDKRSGLLETGEQLITRLRFETSSKIEQALFELPEIIDLLGVSLRSGDGIFRSFALLVPRSAGELAKELAKVLRAVEYGAAFGVEIKKVAKALPHPQVSEFVNKVSLALERGTPLAQMLDQQGVSVREEIRSRLLRQAGRNETRMLIPLVFLILPITVLFAIYPSLELLNFGFI
jgi:tight adherence protein C